MAYVLALPDGAQRRTQSIVWGDTHMHSTWHLQMTGANSDK